MLILIFRPVILVFGSLKAKEDSISFSTAKLCFFTFSRLHLVLEWFTGFYVEPAHKYCTVYNMS